MLQAERREPGVLRFARNLTHLFALLLWVGSLLAWIGGTPELSVAIVVVILVNALFSFAQEQRAERAVEALRHMLPQRVRVRRDGRPEEIVAEDLVPGDVMLLGAGDRVSADGRLVAALDLRLDLSTLTGERPVTRHVAGGAHGRAGVDAPDLVFAGTYVVTGVGEAEVTGTGMGTELVGSAR